MSALPENTPGTPANTPAASPPSSAVTARPAPPRRLHAVYPSQDSGETAPSSTDTPITGDGPSDGNEAAGTGRTASGGWVRAAFAPGSGLYTDRQPSIAETMRRAKRGGQIADTGPLRVAATVHGYLAAANKAACQTWMWIVDHPARLAVFGVLLALAVVFPPTRQLLAWVLAPIVWAGQALD